MKSEANRGIFAESCEATNAIMSSIAASATEDPTCGSLLHHSSAGYGGREPRGFLAKKDSKHIAVLFGLIALLLIVPAVTFAGQWMVVNTFTDDFNRADVTATTNLGPGWVSATNKTGPDYLDHWTIASHIVNPSGGVPGQSVYATNFTLGRIWQVSIDVQWSATGYNAWSVFGSRYMGTNGYLVGVHQPVSKNVWMQVFDRAGGYHAIPGTSSAASLTEGAWYRFTLYHSNDYIRASFVGTDANLDTGWKTNYAEEIFDDIYAGTGGNNYGQKFDNVNVTTYKWVDPGTIISIR